MARYSSSSCIQKLTFKSCMDLYWLWLEECEDVGVKEMGKLVEVIRESEFEKYERAMGRWREDVAEWGELRHVPSRKNLNLYAESKHPNGVDQVSSSV